MKEDVHPLNLDLVNENLLDLDGLISLDSVVREEKLGSIKDELTNFYSADQSIDTSVVNNSLKSLDPMLNSYRRYLNDDLAMKRALPKGASSPSFNEYENFSRLKKISFLLS